MTKSTRHNQNVIRALRGVEYWVDDVAEHPLTSWSWLGGGQA